MIYQLFYSFIFLIFLPKPKSTLPIYIDSSQSQNGDGSFANPVNTFQGLHESLEQGVSDLILISDYKLDQGIQWSNLPQSIRFFLSLHKFIIFF